MSDRMRARLSHRTIVILGVAMCLICGAASGFIAITEVAGGVRWFQAVVAPMWFLALPPLLFVHVARRRGPALFQDRHRVRAAVLVEVPLRIVLLLCPLLSVTAVWATLDEWSMHGTDRATTWGGTLILAFVALSAVPLIWRMACGRLPWMTLELGDRFVYQGWFQRLELDWDQIRWVRSSEERDGMVVLRHRREVVQFQVAAFPVRRDAVVAEIRRRAQAARR
ncbi:hypothetical protein [Nocardioides faecalis]|uniref:hypothetical protein n=1 Tax=Nocardioides faecalis TaxID=2803858 RepID=UPI0019645192|nr:hypothetical protein [Nocardioides faecalis]QVI57302.1 hypothetical protein KG111_09175 [Nocardioides faecalis]